MNLHLVCRLCNWSSDDGGESEINERKRSDLMRLILFTSICCLQVFPLLCIPTKLWSSLVWCTYVCTSGPACAAVHALLLECISWAHVYVHILRPSPSEETSLDEPLMCSFAADVARALLYLSEQSIVHGDVAARNVLGKCCILHLTCSSITFTKQPYTA